MHHTKAKISGMIPKGFKAEKCKVSLKMAMSRMKLLRNKREIQVRQMRRDVAQLLQSGQDQTARIRVEHVIREEKTMAAYELIELYCELIVARINIIDSQKSCPIDLKEAISSVIFASPRCADVQELMDVRKQFLTKYGKDFTTAALELRPDCGVSHMIIEKLSAKAPDTETKMRTLKAISKEHGIEWDSKKLVDELQKNDLLMGSAHLTSSAYTSAQPKPTQFLSASEVSMGYSATSSSTGTVQTSSLPKPTQFLSASEVAMAYSATSSSTNTNSGPASFSQKKSDSTAEGIIGKAPDDQTPQHGGIISSTGSIIYPPPPPPFMTSEGLSPSRTRSEVTSSEGTSREVKTKQKYKDAKAAARAAAESAEQAQLAARAAADLASHEKNARQKAGVEEGTFTMPDLGSVEDIRKQSETKNLHMHHDLVVDDSQSDYEEEEEQKEEGEEGRYMHATGSDRENEYDVIHDKHEPSVAVFDQSDSDIDDHSENLLYTFSQPKEESISSDFYWREYSDRKKQDRSETLFFEDSTRDSSPAQFVSSSGPTFDSESLSSDNESESTVEAKKKKHKHIYSEEREEKEAPLTSATRNTRISYDDDEEPELGLNFGKLTGGLKNKGYRKPPYVKKPMVDTTLSVETRYDHDYDHDAYASSRRKKPPTPNGDDSEVESSSLVSEEPEKNLRVSSMSASRFNTNYFDTEDDVEVREIGRVANENTIKQSRRTRGATTSKVRNTDSIHFGENQHHRLSDEEHTNKSVDAEKSEFKEDQTKSSGTSSSSTNVRSKLPPDYDTLAAHFRSLRTDRP